MSPTTIGIALKLGSVLLFVSMAALIKATSNDVPTGEAVFFRSFFALPVIVGWLLWRGDLATGLRTQRPMGHVWRGLIGACGMGFGFASLGYLPLPEVTALGFTAPLLTTILAAVLLGERIRLFRSAAVLAGLVGVGIVMAPRLTVLGDGALDRAAQIGVVLVLCSAVFRALAQIHIRRLAQSEETAAIVFYFSMTTTVLSLLTLPMGWTLPSPQVAGLLVLSGLIGGVAQILMTSAYRFASAATVAPFDYASILVAMALGYVLFHETPTPQMILGSAVVIASGVLIIWRERQLGLKRGQARKTLTPQG